MLQECQEIVRAQPLADEIPSPPRADIQYPKQGARAIRAGCREAQLLADLVPHGAKQGEELHPGRIPIQNRCLRAGRDHRFGHDLRFGGFLRVHLERHRQAGPPPPEPHAMQGGPHGTGAAPRTQPVPQGHCHHRHRPKGGHLAGMLRLILKPHHHGRQPLRAKLARPSTTGLIVPPRWPVRVEASHPEADRGPAHAEEAGQLWHGAAPGGQQHQVRSLAHPADGLTD
jgi:hypothetical protein